MSLEEGGNNGRTFQEFTADKISDAVWDIELPDPGSDLYSAIDALTRSADLFRELAAYLSYEQPEILDDFLDRRPVTAVCHELIDAYQQLLGHHFEKKEVLH